MALSHIIKHLFTSLKPDGADATVVQPSDWNADHQIVFECGASVVLGRPAGSAGPVTEVPIGSGLSFAAGALTAPGQIPVGVIMDYGGVSVPAGWVICDGRVLLRAVYTELFAVIGTNFGAGDGTTTFNVPDLRGRVAVGRDDMGGPPAGRVTTAGSGIDGEDLGAAGGAQTVTLTEAQLPTPASPFVASVAAGHRHNVVADGVSTSTPAWAANEHLVRECTGGTLTYSLDGVGSPEPTLGATSEGGGHTHVMTGGWDTSDDPHQNMQPSMIVNKIIFANL